MEDPAYPTSELLQSTVYAIEIVAKDGEEAAVGRAMQAMIAPSMAEPGMRLFLPYRSPTDPKSFFIVEFYHDATGRAAHERTEHFKAFVTDTLPRIAARKLTPYSPFSARPGASA